MLILTRRVGEKLIIGDDVTIAVLGVKGNQVRIGIKMSFVVEIRAQCDKCDYVAEEQWPSKEEALKAALRNDWKKVGNKLICDACLGGFSYESFCNDDF